MNRRSIHSLSSLALMLVAGAAFAGGPPSFSFEAPDAKSPTAVLVVHAYSCHAPTDAAVTARAEGMVDGKRKSVPLKLASTGSMGVYTVSRQWPAEGSWVLVFSIDRGGQTTALVKLGADGTPTFEAKDGTRALNDNCVRTVSGKATSKDVEAALASNVR
jgi:hypothetical protein